MRPQAPFVVGTTVLILVGCASADTEWARAQAQRQQQGSSAAGPTGPAITEAQTLSVYHQRARAILGSPPKNALGFTNANDRREYEGRVQELAAQLYLTDLQAGRCPAACVPGTSGTAPTPTASPQ
jgi:hypothetical protein